MSFIVQVTPPCLCRQASRGDLQSLKWCVRNTRATNLTIYSWTSTRVTIDSINDHKELRTVDLLPVTRPECAAPLSRHWGSRRQEGNHPRAMDLGRTSNPSQSLKDTFSFVIQHLREDLTPISDRGARTSSSLNNLRDTYFSIVPPQPRKNLLSSKA